MLQSQTLSWPLLSEPAIWRVIIASHPSAQAVSLLLNRNIIAVQVLGGAAFLGSTPHGASIEDAREELACDLYYVKHRSIVLDLIILASRIRVVLFRQGTR